MSVSFKCAIGGLVKCCQAILARRVGLSQNSFFHKCLNNKNHDVKFLNELSGAEKHLNLYCVSIAIHQTPSAITFRIGVPDNFHDP